MPERQGGVRFLIRWVSDKTGLNRVKSEAAKAGKDAGEGIKKGADKGLTAWQRVKKFFAGPLKTAIMGVVALFAVQRIARFTAALVKMGVDGAETASKFSATFGDAAGVMDQFLDRVGRAAGLSRDARRNIAADMGALAQGFGFTREESAGLAQQMVETAADMTSFANVPMERTTRAISSALAGERESLKLLIGPVTQAAVDQRALAMAMERGSDEATQQEMALATLEEIQAKMGVRTGDLARTMDSQANIARRLAGDWQTLKENVGAALVAAEPANGMMAAISNTLQSATAWVQRNGQAIGAWGRVVVEVFRAAFESIRFVIRTLFNFGQITGRMMEIAANEVLQKFAPALNKVVELLDKIPGVDIDFRIASLPPDEFRRVQGELWGQVDGDMNDVTETVGNLGDAYRRLGGAAMDAFFATGGVGELPDAGEFTPNVPGAPAGAEGAGEEEEEEEGAAFPELVRGATAAELRFERMKELAAETAESMTGSFSNFFDAMTNGFDVTAAGMELLSDVAEGTAQAMIGELVKGKAEYHTAEGIGKLAQGTWPPNPAALAAAGYHFAAAAAFKALPGIVGGIAGGGGGGRSGGGGMGVGSGVGRPGTGEPQTPRGPEMNIFIDPLRPFDPAFQRVIGETVQGARERFGDDLQVNVQPRSTP